MTWDRRAQITSSMVSYSETGANFRFACDARAIWNTVGCHSSPTGRDLACRLLQSRTSEMTVETYHVDKPTSEFNFRAWPNRRN